VALTIFLVAAVLVLYVLLGYPLLLGLLCAVRRPAPVRTAETRPTVSIILPVRNGERWIRAKLRSILALDYPRELLQVIVIDDGSTDRTAALAEAVEGVEVIRLPAGGKALALNAGVARATGNVLFFTDVRQQLDRRSLSSLVSHLADPSVGVVSGELEILEGTTREETDVGLYWRYEKWIRKRLSQLDSVMGATGCIYAMRRALAVPLPAGLLVDDMYLPLAAFFKGYRIVFDENARAFDQPTRLGSEFGRKVRTLAGNFEIIAAYPRLLLPTTRMWVHFVSHKLGRLLVPWALIAIAVTTPFLPRSWMVVAAASQLLVYGSAALDLIVPQDNLVKRVTSPARTFVVMMAAALAAARCLLPGKKDYWKSAVPDRADIPPPGR
jgi:biofilm PGA synthesis N-glycosyltransferase PgaC